MGEEGKEKRGFIGKRGNKRGQAPKVRIECKGVIPSSEDGNKKMKIHPMKKNAFIEDEKWKNENT